MLEKNVFDILFYIFLASSMIVLFILAQGKITAPYGKLASSAWGSFSISARYGWIIMESPSVIFFLFFYILCQNKTIGLTVLFFVWQFHYCYRTLIYPFMTKHSKKMPLMVMVSGFIFQVINTYFQAGWLYYYAPANRYSIEYLKSWEFVVGLAFFLYGSYINRQSDSILRMLRTTGGTEYKIPFGRLYQWVSCPNYLGEIIIWFGWAIMLKSWIGVAFFLWTVANLVPRAISVHKWYVKKFPDYPNNRKAVIPFLL